MRRIPCAQLVSAPEPLTGSPSDAHAVRVLAEHRLHARGLHEAHEDIVAITTRAITALVSEELALKPEHIRAVVGELLQHVRNARQITLRVHPDDRARLPSAQQLAAQAEAEGVIEIVADASLSPGDCVLESDRGDLDARIETKLARLLQQLSARVRS